MEDYKKITDLLEAQSRTLVGVLCKRVEVLDKEKVLTPSLYKSISKEIIYEFFRNLKTLIKLHLEIGKVEFKSEKHKQ